MMAASIIPAATGPTPACGMRMAAVRKHAAKKNLHMREEPFRLLGLRKT
jgi:hypothetical protein